MNNKIGIIYAVIFATTFVHNILLFPIVTRTTSNEDWQRCVTSCKEEREVINQEKERIEKLYSTARADRLKACKRSIQTKGTPEEAPLFKQAHNTMEICKQYSIKLRKILAEKEILDKKIRNLTCFHSE